MSKISVFSFTFKLNKKEKVPLKKIGLERGVYKNIFAGGGVWLLIGGWKYLKGGAWQERGKEKIEGEEGLWPSIKTMMII